MKTLQTSNKKQIYIFDDLFDFKTRNNFYQFILGSFYKLKGQTSDTLDFMGEYHIFSEYSPEDVDAMGILTHESSKEFLPLIEEMEFLQARINLGTLYDKNRFHVDTTKNKKSITLLYYANMNWDIESGGHTLFANEDISDMEHCVMFKPGRLIAFDGTIPHCILSPNIASPSYRFAMAIQFREK